jgi:SAM-dependent methyltransferase
MCNVYCILFGAINLQDEEIRGKKVLEIGSHDLNGSLRPFVESRKPEIHVGVDIVEGSGVDIICDATDLLDKFKEESFDIVISTELLEHVRNWRKVISNIKKVCKPGGVILLTTRSIGFQFHAYPYDFWRYQPEDMEYIFSDCEILAIKKDPRIGVFIKARKPVDFTEKDVSDYELYSIVLNKRTKQIVDKKAERSWYFRRLVMKSKTKDLILKILAKFYELL